MRDFHLPGRSPVLAAQGMCATSHPLAARAAIDILERGGNAMDAAIAGAALLGICEPQMTGIGGDCFVLWNAPGSDVVQAFNGSGRAPAGTNAQALRERGETTVPLYGTEAVTIPGAIDAFCTLAESQGRIGLDAILAPAIHYADAGVPIAPRVAQDWITDSEVLQGHGRRHYLLNGQVPKTGQMFRAPGQAEVLRRIAAHGRDAFYTGEVADDMLAAVQAMGGTHTAADFASHTGDHTTPIACNYKGT